MRYVRVWFAPLPHQIPTLWAATLVERTKPCPSRMSSINGTRKFFESIINQWNTSNSLTIKAERSTTTFMRSVSKRLPWPLPNEWLKPHHAANLVPTLGLKRPGSFEPNSLPMKNWSILLLVGFVMTVSHIADFNFEMNNFGGFLSLFRTLPNLQTWRSCPMGQLAK